MPDIGGGGEGGGSVSVGTGGGSSGGSFGSDFGEWVHECECETGKECGCGCSCADGSPGDVVIGMTGEWPMNADADDPQADEDWVEPRPVTAVNQKKDPPPPAPPDPHRRLGWDGGFGWYPPPDPWNPPKPKRPWWIEWIDPDPPGGEPPSGGGSGGGDGSGGGGSTGRYGGDGSPWLPPGTPPLFPPKKYADPCDPKESDDKSCVVRVYCGPIAVLGVLGIVHCWVEVTHCNGVTDRYDKWQSDMDDEDAAKKGSRFKRLTTGGSDPEDSNVFLNLMGPGSWPEPGKELVGTLNYPCLDHSCGGDGADLRDPPQCARATPEEVAKYNIRDFYNYLSPNSNTFAQDLLDHMGIGSDEIDLPAGAVGSDFPGTTGFNSKW